MKTFTLDSRASLLLLLTLSTNLAAADSNLKNPKWTFDTIGHVVATPTIAVKDGTVYAGTIDDGTDDTIHTSEYKNSFLWAITEQGKKKWMLPFLAASQQSSPALSLDEKVIYVTANRNGSNSHDAKSSRGILAAINTATHKPIKDFNDGDSVLKASTAFGRPQVKSKTGEVFLNAAVIKEYVLHGYVGQHLYIFSQNGLLKQDTLFYPEFPTTLWHWSSFSSLELVFNKWGGVAATIQTASPKYAIVNSWGDNTQQQLWVSEPLSLDKNTTPQLAVDINGENMYVVDSNGSLVAYDTANSTGQSKTPAWTYSPPEGKFSPSVPAVIAESTTATAKTSDLYVGGADGYLYVVRPNGVSGPSANSLVKIPVSDAALVTRPVVDNTNNILYVVDANRRLFAVDLRLEDPNQSRILWHAEEVMGVPAVSPFDSSVVVSGTDNTVKAYVGGR